MERRSRIRRRGGKRPRAKEGWVVCLIQEGEIRDPVRPAQTIRLRLRRLLEQYVPSPSAMAKNKGGDFESVIFAEDMEDERLAHVINTATVCSLSPPTR